MRPASSEFPKFPNEGQGARPLSTWLDECGTIILRRIDPRADRPRDHQIIRIRRQGLPGLSW
jgi:hypothetical protein